MSKTKSTNPMKRVRDRAGRFAPRKAAAKKLAVKKPAAGKPAAGGKKCKPSKGGGKRY